MKNILLHGFLLFFVFANAQTKNRASENGSRTIPFDSGWLFLRDGVLNAEQPIFNDSKWRKVDLPHDWSVEDLPNQVRDSISGPFTKGSVGGNSTGYTVGGTGWYRKKFTTGKGEQNKLISLYFDGVYMNADVWLNGHHLGSHTYGYTPFSFDLTPYLNPAGKNNVLAVRVRNEGKNSRWYSGSGIYRHVRLIATAPVHVAHWGVFITTPQVTQTDATVKISTTINNQQASTCNVNVITTIVSPEGRIVGRTQKALSVSADASKTDSQSINITGPVLWSVETPKLYKAVIEIRNGSKLLDRMETPFGIRSIRFDAATGFTLNGKRVLLKGGCIHHDNGPLGAAALDRAEERKIEILKKNGYNAVRTSHNPPSQALLDACDRLGMLVIDEAFDMWEVPKNPEDYHLYFQDWWKKDLRAMMLRDRNHPSIILWSVGNEIPERADTLGLRIREQLAAEVHRLDPSRPVTESLCAFWEPRNKGKEWSATAPAFAQLDIGGYNYLWQQYEPDHEQHPNRIMLGTESFPKEALQNWNMVEKHPYVIGDFVWTAFDYMGEASIGHTRYDTDTTQKLVSSLGWPWYNAWCGDIDLIGNKKPQSYFRDVVWRQRPIAMAVHTPVPDSLKEFVSMWGWPDEWQSWTWPGVEGKPLQVRVFSRAPVVRLYLNGKIAGEQKIADSTITAVFNVPYQPGTLKAVNIVNGKEGDAYELKTAGAPKRIRMTVDRNKIKSSRNDLAYVMVEVVDADNQVVPTATILVQFSINGGGELVAVGNADPTDVSSFQQPERKTFRGTCLAIVRPKGKSGEIRLNAMAPGLTPAQIIITTH